MEASRSDVIVVGGGLAGLTAAAYLARAGRRVALFESGALGGRAATQDHAGYLFNEGPHALYAGGPAVRIFAELGVEFTGDYPDPNYSRAIVGGELYGLPRNPETLLATQGFSDEAKQEIAAILPRLVALDPESVQHVTVTAWLEAEVQLETVRQLIRALFRLSTYSDAPDVESMGATITQFQLGVAHNVFYLDGGWQTLIDGLQDVAEAKGAVIRDQTRVKSVEPAGGGWRVTLANGEIHEAASVILTVRPNVAAALVKGSTALAGWAERALPVRAACLDIGMRRLTHPAVQFALGVDEPLYYSVHTRSARLAPDGGAVVQVAKYLGAEPPADPAAIERELEALMDLAQPGWREEVTDRRYLPKMIVANWTPSAAEGGLAGRPGPAVPDAAGLFVAGDWVGPEGLLADASVASGKAAAHLALAATARAKREPEYALR